MGAGAEEEEAAAVVDEVAVVLEAEVAGLVAGLAAAGCRVLRHRLAARRRLADQRRGRAAAEAFRVPLAALLSPRAASVAQAARVRVALAARDPSRDHRRDSRPDRDRARLTSRAGGPVVRDPD
jgi:hypothetical protein